MSVACDTNGVPMQLVVSIDVSALEARLRQCIEIEVERAICDDLRGIVRAELEKQVACVTREDVRAAVLKGLREKARRR